MVSALNRMLLRDLWHLRAQLVAAALVVACGVASFVAMRSTYESLRTSQATYYQSFRFADVFTQLKRAPESMARQIREIPGVADMRTRVVMDVTLDIPGLDEPATGRLVSIPDRPSPMVNDFYIRQGRYVEPGRSEEVMVSEAFAVANGLTVGDQIGAIMNGRWKQLRIVGIALSPEYVYEVGSGTIFPDNRRFGVLWMSREVLGPAFNMEGAFNDVAIMLAAGTTVADVINRLDLLLARYGGLGAYDREEQISHRFLSDEISQNRISSTYVPAIFFSVATFLFHLVLSRLVSMQRPEIALLKAFGYRNLTVGLHYLKLALVTVSGGLVVGIVLGLYLETYFVAIYREYYHFPGLASIVSPDVIVLAVLVSLSAATLGAAATVRRAVVLPPAEAMRPEPPARFKAGVIEQTGLHRMLPASARIIVRNIVRRRWKAFLSVLGISFAVGILVVGGFFLDAIQYLMNVQFELVQRDDVTVLFHQPLSPSARFDLGHLPGVLRSEPFRSVPARLRFEHRSRRIELIGLSPDSELRRLIDKKLQVVDLPQDGIILTTKLAEILGVKPGDSLTIEVLEAARPVWQVPLAGLADELVGIAAYMDVRAVNRMMREDIVSTGAYLLVDPLTVPTLYKQLKQTPAVSGVAIREAVLKSFREILDRSVMFSTVLNIVFACIIAFGMVYNSARIALSERGNDLASLRVLGFKKREVAMILLGEQAVLTVLAIPLGWALGYGVCWLLSYRMQTELYRIPLVVERDTFAFAFIVVAIAAILSGLLVAKRLTQLDLIAVLKTRE